MNLAGQYRLYPGTSPSICGGRPVVGGDRVGRLLRGQHGQAVVQTLGQVFSLCAHAHRHAARLALQAAQQQVDLEDPPAATVALQLETARDHLRSMALDWPARLDPAHPPTRLPWLAQCPLPLSASAPAPTANGVGQSARPLTQLAELGRWLQQHAAQLPFVQTLARWQAPAQALRPASRTLDLLDTDPGRQAAGLRTIATALAANPDFARIPQWQGGCAETGVWSRLRQRHSPAAAPSAWSRLHARWDELQQLCASPEAVLLHSGALPLGNRQAIAWCEMARGLLLHWVQLDAAQQVQDYRVLAPTEWNFHPQGALAQALTQLDAADAASARCLGAAYDPCVACSIDAASKETLRA